MNEAETLAERVASLEGLLERAELGILVADVETRRFRFANRRICEMLGYSREELLALCVSDIHPPERLDEVERAFAAQLTGSLRTALGLPLRRKDGTVLPADISSGPVIFEGRECLLGMFQDASELEALTEEVRASTNLLEAVLDAIPDVIGVQDRSHRIIRYNEAGYRFLGLSPRETHGKKCFELIGQIQPCEICATSEALRTRAPSQARKYVEQLDVWLDARSYPMLDENGEVVHVIEHLRDITAEVRAEEKLRANEEQIRHMHKMQAIGTLAGGVAHDFNNLLTPILGLANMIGNHPDVPEPILEAAQVIERAAARAAELTQQLLGFARKGKLREEPVDVHELVRDTLSMLTRTIHRRITIVPRLCSDTPSVLGDPGQLRQVLLNLAVNARDAMPEGGTLTLRTRITDGPNDEPSVVIEVIDTGVGIAASDIERIFEPFFSTKEEAKGTGLGLAMVYGIVENHRGRIEVESEPGRGATFRLWLPLTEVLADPAPSAETVVRGRGCVLVIDDEELVLFVAERMLQSLGYDVLTATDGAEGEAVFREHQEHIDVVIIDLIMPRTGGRECFRRLKSISPDVRALLSSGYSEDAEIQELLAEGMVGFVKKPFLAAELSRALAAVLTPETPDI